MKHQLSKVAAIATLAFIGIGFAGTQQANASNCPPDYCGDSKNCLATLVAKYGLAGAAAGRYTIEDNAVFIIGRDTCLDCKGNCTPTLQTVDTWDYRCRGFKMAGTTPNQFDPVTDNFGTKRETLISPSKTANAPACAKRTPPKPPLPTA